MSFPGRWRLGRIPLCYLLLTIWTWLVLLVSLSIVPSVRSDEGLCIVQKSALIFRINLSLSSILTKVSASWSFCIIAYAVGAAESWHCGLWRYHWIPYTSSSNRWGGGAYKNSTVNVLWLLTLIMDTREYVSITTCITEGLVGVPTVSDAHYYPSISISNILFYILFAK